MKLNGKLVVAGAVAGIIVMFAGFLTGCGSAEKQIDDVFRILGSTPGTFYNYGADGASQVGVVSGEVPERVS